MRIQNLPELGWDHFFQSQLSLDALSTQLPFRVTAVHRNLIECVGLDHEQQPQTLQLSTHHWRQQEADQQPTVGDWITVDLQLQPVALLERQSLIKRRSAGRESSVQLIAANINTLFVVTSCNDDFNLNRIERYLAIAAEAEIHCVLILTKIDLCEDYSELVTALARSHPDLPIEAVNATDNACVEGIKQWIGSGQTIALLGSSGVGKSTLANSLLGDDLQATHDIREADSKGRHTTTSRSLHLLQDGGLLMDTPGMRELQIVDSEAGIKTVFSEIEQLAQYCRFHDCQHQSEPGCAVIKAANSGQLEQRLVDNYHKLLSEQARNNESLAERRQSDKNLGKFYKSAMKSAMKFKSRE